MGALSGKTIVVTGALGVLGRSVAGAAEAAGARVAHVDHVKTEQSGELIFHGVDLTDEAATGATMAQVARVTGGIDGLVNIAGGFVYSAVSDSPAKLWESMFRLNLLTAVNASRAAMPYLTAGAGGAIVNIGAGAAARAGAGMAPYAASKAGVARLTEALAEELAGKVRVNAVLPSIIDTPTNRKDMPKADFSTWVQADDIAKVILFLLSEESHAITGAAVPVTVGRS
jgi:NAD(P)-dependent dehydrogenase (short-subunit alcohol dehydrogenase family)